MAFIRENLPDPVSYFESEGLKLTSKGKWRTTACTFHGGGSTMRINTTNGAWVCMALCGARGGDVLAYHMAAHGMDFIEAAKALGAWQDDGKPHVHHRPKPLPPGDALQLLAEEALIVAVAAGNIAHGVILTDQDRERCQAAAGRINLVAGF
jgi:hypothetical protein